MNVKPALLGLALAIAASLPTRAVAEPHLIEVQPDETFQTIDGWGTCLVAWVPRMREFYQTEAFETLYVDEMGANMLRINLWGGVHDKPVDRPEDVRAADFDFAVSGGRPQVFVDVGKQLRERDPEMKFIGSVWSPPAWMKVNGSITDAGSGAIGASAYERNGRTFDNRVDPKYFEHFAQWMVEMVKYHDEAGVPLYAVSPANEPMFTQGFESCVWTAKDLATVSGMIRERLDAQGYEDVKIFGPETMTGHNHAEGNLAYVREMNDSVDVWATHGYTDGVSADVSANSSADFWKLVEDTGKPYWVTEGGTGGHDWPEPLNGVASMLHNALVHGHASAVVPWQISELGEPSTHNLMVGDEIGKKANAARQYWRFVRPGAVRVAVTPSDGTDDARVAASAFVHEQDKTATAILLNLAEVEQEVTLDLGGLPVSELKVVRTDAEHDFETMDSITVEAGTATIVLPGQSITTLQGDLGS